MLTKKTLSLFVAAFLFCCAACAQQSNTIIQTLLTNSSVTGPTAPVNNIGQSQHRATAVFTNQNGHTCTGNASLTDLAFEASMDGSTWFEIGVPSTNSSTTNAGVITSHFEADGAYPYVRVNVHGFDTTNCKITLQYQGTLYPNPAGSAILPNYLTGNLRTIPININATASGNYVLFSNPSATRFPIVYGLFLSVNNAACVAILNGAGFTCLNANDRLILPTSGIPWTAGGRGADLQINTNAATQISGYIVLRLEDNP